MLSGYLKYSFLPNFVANKKLRKLSISYLSILFCVITIIQSSCTNRHFENLKGSKGEILAAIENSEGTTRKRVSRYTRKIVAKIAKINEVQGPFVGLGGNESENYPNFVDLIRTASVDELVQLSKHTNNTVACYASMALAERSFPDFREAFARFVKHDREVKIFSGCIRSTSSIAIQIYFHYWNTLDKDSRSSDEHLQELDGLILFSKRANRILLPLSLKNRVYADVYKYRIAELAFNEGEIDAVAYLYRWHKSEYEDQLKAAILKYFETTDFSQTGLADYYETVYALLGFEDASLHPKIVAKLREDKHWMNAKGRFEELLQTYHVIGWED
jgi:hypothetical protein